MPIKTDATYDPRRHRPQPKPRRPVGTQTHADSSLRVCDRVSIGESIAIDFIGRGNIWIDNVIEADSVALARHLINEALANTAAGQLSIVGYDGDLTGVFAPFAALSAGDVRQLSLLSSERELRERLSLIRQQIQATQNVIQGRAPSLLQFRRDIGRPVEGYQLVVLVCDLGMASDELRGEVALLMRSGPAAGITFLVVSTSLITVNAADEDEVILRPSDLDPRVHVLEAEGRRIRTDGGSEAILPARDAHNYLDTARRCIERSRATSLPIVRYDEIHDLSRTWWDSTRDGVTFGVGKYGLEDVFVTLGDEVAQRHNALITGAVGQGKSNLISVIVHSMCQRYSPDELQLYLLDFKEGVTFKAFSNIGKDDYLPHAATLGLESDVSFGIAVLDALHDEYRRRMSAMKDASVRSLREYRTGRPGASMPRIVAIIDEFQMMFGDDTQTGAEIAGRLERAVRLYRAAGIHFILSSQTLGGNLALSQRSASLFAQVPVRIALKNSEAESLQTLGSNNRAAAFLRPREAIVNLDYGEVSQNRRTVVAFADEAVLAPMRLRWWGDTRRSHGAPYVFESERRASIAHAVADVRALRAAGHAPCAVVGNHIAVDGRRVRIPLPAEPGRNVAIIGTPDTGTNHAAGIAQSALVSLAFQHPRGDARFLLCDFTDDGAHLAHHPAFAELMVRAGFYVEEVRATDFGSVVSELAEESAGDETTYLAALGLDRWGYKRDPYGQGSPLKALVEAGPSMGIHLIGWWTKASSFNDQVSGYGGSDAFNTKLFLRVDERTVQSLVGPYAHWTSQTNRALLSDPVEYAREKAVIPYAPVGPEDVGAFGATVWQ